MTVIDEVMSAEKAAEEKLMQAKEASAQATIAAKKEQAAAIESEKTRLSEVAKSELDSNAARVAILAQGIIDKTESQVQTIQADFTKKAGEISQKIKSVLS